MLLLEYQQPIMRVQAAFNQPVQQLRMWIT